MADSGDKNIKTEPDESPAAAAAAAAAAEGADETKVKPTPMTIASLLRRGSVGTASLSSSLIRQPQVSLQRIPISIVPRRVSVPVPMSESPSTSVSLLRPPPPEIDTQLATSTSVTHTHTENKSEIKIESRPQPQSTTPGPIASSSASASTLMESETFSQDNLTSLPLSTQGMYDDTSFDGTEKKKRGHRGPDKTRNIDPTTGKRRYIKRNIKRFGLLNGEDVDYDLNTEYPPEKKKHLYATSRYLNSGIPRIRIRGISSLHRPHHYHKHRHHRHKFNKKYTEDYVTPLAKEEELSDDEEDSNWEDEPLPEDLVDPVWRPTDDLRLLLNVLQTNDLKKVYIGTKFSCHFPIESIEARWAYLLYDKASAKVAQNAIRSLPGRVREDIYSKAMFSNKENEVLKKVKSTLEVKHSLPVMKKVLNDNPLVFLQWRTARQLLTQWMHLRDFHMLCDQNIKDYFKQQSFTDFEASVDDEELIKTPYQDESVMREKLILRKMTKKKIRKLEEDVKRWQAISERFLEVIPRVFEEGTLAMLRGKQVRYLMRSKEITLGRRTEEENMVDADLALEGSTYKISRRQGIIRMRKKGDFIIHNQGKHAIYLNGRPLQPQTAGVLRDNSVIQISLLSFVFIINQKVIRDLQKRQQLFQNATRARRDSFRRCSSGSSNLPKAKYFPSLSSQLPYYQPPFQSTSSSPFSLQSILSPTFSNTLPLTPSLNFKIGDLTIRPSCPPPAPPIKAHPHDPHPALSGTFR